MPGIFSRFWLSATIIKQALQHLNSVPGHLRYVFDQNDLRSVKVIVLSSRGIFPTNVPIWCRHSQEDDIAVLIQAIENAYYWTTILHILDEIERP